MCIWVRINDWKFSDAFFSFFCQLKECAKEEELSHDGNVEHLEAQISSLQEVRREHQIHQQLHALSLTLSIERKEACIMHACTCKLLIIASVYHAPNQVMAKQQSQLDLAESLLSKKDEDLGRGRETIERGKRLLSSVKDELVQSEALVVLKDQVTQATLVAYSCY